MMGYRVKLTYLLRRDLHWWTQLPSTNNGRSIFSPIETFNMHCDNSGYGWRAVLNGQLEARGLWPQPDHHEQHITLKELKAVRLAVISFLPFLRSWKVLLCEDRQAMVAMLSHLTSRLPPIMDVL
jgi:hypothetical protein